METEVDVSGTAILRVYKYLKENDRIDRMSKNYQKKIAEEIELSRFVVWRALKVLEKMEVVSKEREGKKNIVSLN